jgi:peroxiredoxin
VPVGLEVPFISLLNSDGTRREVKLNDGQSSVLYVVAPSCPWCARNLENIRTLGAARAKDFRFIGISITSLGLEEYRRETPMPFPIELVDAEHLPAGLELWRTPQMIVVGPDGRVKKAWNGALSGERLEEAEKFFDLDLPGAEIPPRRTVKGPR